MAIDFNTPATAAELGLDILDNPVEVNPEVKEEAKPEPKEEREEVKESDDHEDDSSEDDDGEEEAKEEVKPRGRTDKRVPYNRFKEKTDEANSYKAELERERARNDAEIKRLQAELESKSTKKAPEPEKVSVDIDGLEEKYQELITNMEYDQAKKLRKEINSHLIEQAEERSSKKVEKLLAERDKAFREEQEAKETARQQKEFTKAAAEITKKYEFLDSKSDKADKKAIRLFIMERDDLLESGMDPLDAFKAAAESVAPLFGGTVEKNKASAAVAERNAEANRKAEDASKRIPPSTSKSGVGAKTEDTSIFKSKNFTQKDWEKASEDDRLKALGLK